jgi:hypothetical protein
LEDETIRKYRGEKPLILKEVAYLFNALSSDDDGVKKSKKDIPNDGISFLVHTQ